MADILIRDAVDTDFARIVELNAAEVLQTSAMDLDRLRVLHGIAGHHRVAVVDGRVAGFVLAMPHGADYRNDNYRWFSARYRRFLYVDRIVVDAAAKGLGVGRRLYEDLFAHARAHGIGTVTCEYNLDPPNPASKAFHDRFGFGEVGTRRIADAGKRVSMQAAEA